MRLALNVLLHLIQGVIMTDQAAALGFSSLVSAALSRKRAHCREIKAHIAQYRYVVFYGCGTAQQDILKAWERYIGHKIDFCGDTNSAKWGKTFCGVTCLSLDELRAIKDECAIFITVTDFRPILNDLKKMNFNSIQTLSKQNLKSSYLLSNINNENIEIKLRNIYYSMKTKPSWEAYNATLCHALDDPDHEGLLLDILEDNRRLPQEIMELFENRRFEELACSRRIDTGSAATFPS